MNHSDSNSGGPSRALSPVFKVLARDYPPFLHILPMSLSEATNLAISSRLDPSAPAQITTLRGCKMTTFQGLLDELAAALQFPYYFGENLNALEECLHDLSWLPAPAHALLIMTTTDLLSQETDEELAAFTRLLERVASSRREPAPPIRNNASPFHVLFQTSSNEARDVEVRLFSAGMSPSVLRGETVTASQGG